MKYIRYGVIFLALFILTSLVVLSITSRFKEPPQMVNGKLTACPDFQNCICTESYSNQNFKPIAIDLNKSELEWNLLKSAILETGGEIQKADGIYVWATFVTPLLRFVDDFEARLDTSKSCIQLRSASRVGEYDFGTNLKRINRVLKIFQELRKNNPQ
jgi:uncharacterized protein (DUF1499 family)